MPLTFRKAEKTKSKLRLALIGPAGSGKTYTALLLAHGLAEGQRIAVIDTERGSASLYADLFAFDVLELDDFSPVTYVEAITAAEVAGYGVIVIDSLSHAWEGKGGALDLVDQATRRGDSGGNSHFAWRKVTPLHSALVDAMLQSRAHVIATTRAKTEYVEAKDARGKTTYQKAGTRPIQREGLDYEFTLVADMNHDHDFIVSKSRIPAMTDQVINRPTETVAQTLLRWLNSGVEAPQAAALAPTADGTAPAPTPIRPPASGRPAPAMHQAQAVDAASDLSPREFGEQARALGFTTADGDLDYARIADVLKANEGKSPGHALLVWREKPGHTYGAALTLLENARQRSTETAGDGEPPQQRELVTVPAEHVDPDSVRPSARQ